MKLSSSLSMRAVTAAAAAGLILLQAACSPTGNGIGPVRLVVNGPTGLVDAPSARIFECIRNPITATLYFSDGSAGNFTNRVVWSSSNPAVVRVSNGDEPAPAPSTGFFANGVLTPVAPGTATVTATYLGLTDSIQVSVGTPANLKVHVVNPQNGQRIDPPGNSFRIGVSTLQDLSVTASLDGVETNLDGAASWAFDAPNTAIATIDAGSGVVTGVAAGGPLVARASFAPCALSASTSVSVAPVQALSIVPEFGTANLIVPNSEAFTVLADFGDGPEQDVSLQSTLSSSLAAAGTFSTGIGTTNLLFALTAGGPFNVTATIKQGDATITSAPVAVTTVTDTLQSIAVTPASASIVAGSNQVAQFTVTGSYLSGATQPVTRLASWATTDATIGQVLTGTQLAGQAVSTGTTPGTVTLTATVPSATVTPTATATLTTTAAPAP